MHAGLGLLGDHGVEHALDRFSKAIDVKITADEYWDWHGHLDVQYACDHGTNESDPAIPHVGPAMFVSSDHESDFMDMVNSPDKPLRAAIASLNGGRDLETLHRSWYLQQLEEVLELVIGQGSLRMARFLFDHIMATLPPWFAMANRLQRAQQMTEQERAVNLGSLTVLPCDVLDHIAKLVKQ